MHYFNAFDTAKQLFFFFFFFFSYIFSSVECPFFTNFICNGKKRSLKPRFILKLKSADSALKMKSDKKCKLSHTHTHTWMNTDCCSFTVPCDPKIESSFFPTDSFLFILFFSLIRRLYCFLHLILRNTISTIFFFFSFKLHSI